MTTRTADTLVILGALGLAILAARWAWSRYQKRVEEREDRERARRVGGGGRQ